MTKEEEIKSIEWKIRNMFDKDKITDADIIDSSKLINRWKFLTNYVSDKTPVLSHTIDEIIDEQPNYKTKNNENN